MLIILLYKSLLKIFFGHCLHYTPVECTLSNGKCPEQKSMVECAHVTSDLPYGGLLEQKASHQRVRDMLEVVLGLMQERDTMVKAMNRIYFSSPFNRDLNQFTMLVYELSTPYTDLPCPTFNARKKFLQKKKQELACTRMPLYQPQQCHSKSGERAPESSR